MTIILTCDNCHRTSATTAEMHEERLPRRKETWLTWYCPRCGKHHQWRIPRGRSVEDTARGSRKSSPAYESSAKREDVYRRTKEAPPGMQKWILFGELIWWWREEAGITQAKAAATAGRNARHWIRIEAGESKLRDKNIEDVVHAVEGSMGQAFLLLSPRKRWGWILERRLERAEAQIEDKFFSKLPDNTELPPTTAQDIGVALREIGRVLVKQSDAQRFLFYAYMVHQEFWNRRLSGTIVVDEYKTELIPLFKKLIDVFRQCETGRDKYDVIRLMVEEAQFFMPRPLILDLATYFIRLNIGSWEKTGGKLGGEWNQFTLQEKLVLALFDLIEPPRQPHILRACKQVRVGKKER